MTKINSCRLDVILIGCGEKHGSLMMNLRLFQYWLSQEKKELGRVVSISGSKNDSSG